MMQMLILMLLLFTLSFMLIAMNLVISKKSFQDREKISPFECGFDPLSETQLPFSIHFFMISLIFLIFDIEITLLLLLIYLSMKYNIFMILTSISFLLILNIGLYIEYSEQSIDWKM